MTPEQQKNYELGLAEHYLTKHKLVDAKLKAGIKKEKAKKK